MSERNEFLEDFPENIYLDAFEAGHYETQTSAGQTSFVRSEFFHALLEAAKGVAVKPWGYCVCAVDMEGRPDEDHTPECRALRAAIAAGDVV